MQEKAILDITSLSALEYEGPASQVEEFQRIWGTDPQAVALPVMSPAGPLFENEFIEPVGVHLEGQLQVSLLGGVAKEFAKLGLDVYLTLNPGLSFIRNDSLHVIGIAGDSAPQVCFAKPKCRALLQELLASAVEKVDSLVQTPFQ